MDIFYTAMENTMAHLILYLNKISGPQTLELLLSQKSLSVDVAPVLCQNRRRAVLTASPAWSLAGEPDCPEGDGSMVCDAYVYEVCSGADEGGEGASCRLYMTQMKVSFVNEGGLAKICKLNWQVLQTMEPWAYGNENICLEAAATNAPAPFDCFGFGRVPSDIYIAIRKAVVYPWDQLWLKEDSAQNGQLYVCGGLPGNLKKPLIGVTTFPAVEITGEGKARARLVAQVFGIGENACQEQMVVRCFYLVEYVLEKQGQEWKLSQTVLRPMMRVPDTPYRQDRRYDKISADILPWELGNCRTPVPHPQPPAQSLEPFAGYPVQPAHPSAGYPVQPGHPSAGRPVPSEHPSTDYSAQPGQPADSLQQSGDFTQDSYAIENIVNGWVYACRRGQLCRFYKAYMKHDGFVPTMHIRSQGAKTKKLVGEKEILGKLSGMDARFRPGMLTFHTATTPLVEISSDGTRATGTWFDHSATNLSGGDAASEEIPYMVFVARYRHEFCKLDGKWYLTDFFWEPLISLDDWIWNSGEHVKGQVSEGVGGPKLIRDLSSPTGYYVNFTYKAPSADHVGIIGDWMFSDIYHSSRWKSAAIWPQQWQKGMFPHALLGLKKTPEALTAGESQTGIDPSKFEFDWDILKQGLYEMKKSGDDGSFSITLPLPSGIFNYRFVLDMPEGNPLKMVTVPDPGNPPVTVGEKGQAFSQVYVPFDKERQILDRSVELPLTDSQGGSLISFQYETAPEFDDGKRQYGAIYLPEGYDPASPQPYPVLYLSHGGSGNAGDWPAQGGLKNIMDHLIHEGRVEPMAVVVMDNEEFHWDNPGKCIPNLTRYLIPEIETNYHVGGASCRRAFAGFSAGGFLAYETLASVPQLFDYIGVWSGGKRVNVLPDPKANPRLKVHIGAGRYDDAYFSFGFKLEDLLGGLGIEFTSFFPEGGHQWSVWRQLLEDFAGRVLWK